MGVIFFEKWIAPDGLLECLLEFHCGELQEFDRLLQSRCEGQLLTGP
jgi:hypothetical protein